MSDWLPREVIERIFIKLPIKDVVTCTSVCKAWNSLIKDPNFISTHLKKQQTDGGGGGGGGDGLIFLLRRWNIKRDHFTLLHSNNNTHSELEFPFKGKNLNFDVLGCCNGLVFLADHLNAYSHTLIVWNPSIRRALVLPQPTVQSARDCLLGLGFDSRDNDYKVLRICCRQNTSSFEAELFSLNANCWKAITASAPPPKFYVPELSSSTFVNGAIHWIGLRSSNECSNFIVRFNVRDEVFDEIELPESLVGSGFGSLKLMNYRDSSIAVVERKTGRTDIWLMTRYGRVDSWNRVFSGSLGESGGTVLWFTKEDEVLLRKNPETISDLVHLVSLNMNTGSMDRLVDRNKEDGTIFYQYFAHGFVESLVLLDKGKPATPTILNSDDESNVGSSG